MTDTQYTIRYTTYDIQSTKNYVRIYQQIMQNKPNVKDAKIDISHFITIKYVKLDTWLSWKNKPNQTQFKANSNPISETPEINVNVDYTIDYNNKTAFRRIKNKPKQTQFQTQPVVSLSNLFQTQLKAFCEKGGLWP